MDDVVTIDAVLAGDKERYSELIDRYQRLVYGIAWSRLGDRDLAEDAAQETFIKAFQYLGTLRQRGRFGWWIGRIARNVSVNLGRRHTKDREVANKYIQLTQTQSMERGSVEREQTLWSAMANLPQTHRETLTIFYIDGMNVAQSATQLGISESAMKVRLYRARTALREGIETALDNALSELSPSPHFNASVMAILPISPMGFVNTAGITALAAKLGAGLSFTVFVLASQIAVVGGIFWLTTKAQQMELKNGPENAFRRKLIARQPLAIIGYIVPFMAVTMIVTPYLIAVSSIDTLYIGLGVVTLLMLVPVARRLRVNSNFVGWVPVISEILMSAAFFGIGLFHWPFVAFIIPAIAPKLLLAFAMGNSPRHVDYNLFLRAATDGFGASKVALPEGKRITDTEMRQFARFLGERFLINDYQLTSDSIAFSLVGVGLVGTPLWKRRDSNDIRILRNGDCFAEITDTQLKSIESLTGTSIIREEINQKVADALRDALASFLDGSPTGAESILAAKSETEIYVPRNKGTSNLVRALVLLAVFVSLCLGATNNWTTIVAATSPSDSLPHLAKGSGMPYTKQFYDISGQKSEWFSPVYSSIPLLLTTSIHVDKDITLVVVTGLDHNHNYAISSNPASITISPDGKISAPYGYLYLDRTPTGFEKDTKF